MNTFFYVNKPKGITSFSVCHQIQKAYNLKKCGHNGTLDPDATGVMLVACDKATKLLPFFNIHDKTYEAEFEFGFETTTLDASGEIVNFGETNIELNKILEAIDVLYLQKEQIPPMYSAIKLNGKKMVDLARKNINVDLPPREINYLSKPKIINYLNVNGKTIVKIRLEVSKGFYVRSFGRDLGRLVKSCATMISLNRIASGSINIDNASSLDDILNKKVQSIDIACALNSFARLDVNDYIAHLVKNGVKLDERQTNIDNNLLIYNNDKLIAVYKKNNKNYECVVILEGDNS